MKKLNAVLLVLLAISSLVFSAESKNPAVLLQEGLYTEQTEGEIEKAMEIYQQIIREAGKTERIAARATYRIGVCYQKLSQNEKAAEYFRKVLSDYPSQVNFTRKAGMRLKQISTGLIIEDRPYNIWFKPTTSEITTKQQLLEAFNKEHPDGVNTFRYRTKDEDGEIIGKISVGDGAGKDEIVKMLKRNPKLDVVKVEPSYTIVFKASGGKPIDKNGLLDLFNANYPDDVSTYYYRTSMEDGNLTGYISTDTEQERDKLIDMVNANPDLTLEKVMPESKTKECIFTEIDGQVIRFISGKYGETAEQAGQENLFANSHIYYVNSDFVLYKGGMNSYYNWTGRSVSSKVKLTGTSYPNQTLYDAAGQELNTEIVPADNRPSHWLIYWIPEEPLAPGEYLYYGWSLDNTRKLPSTTGQAATFRMQNQFGSPVIEIFFLVLPKELQISESNPPTGSEELLNFNVYWWTETMRQGENHVENVTIEKSPVQKYSNMLDKPVSVEISKSPSGNRLSVQYGVIAVCKEADVPYNWDKSAELADPQRRQFIEPINVKNKPAKEILENILSPVGLTYELDSDGLYLKNEIIGKWESVDFVSSPNQFQPGMQQWKGNLFLKEITFNPNGSSSKPWKWTNGWIQEINGDAKAKYFIKRIEGQKYLFFPWLSGDVTERGRKPKYYVLKAAQTTTSQNQDKLQAEDLAAEGWNLWRQRKLSEAEKKFKQATEKDPTNDNAYQGLGWAQFNQGKNLNAKESFEKCIRLNPENSAALNGLGWIAKAEGNTDEAIEWWEKAVEASSGNATAAFSGLTQVYTERGDYENAVKYYKMWLNVDPDNEQTKEGLKEAKESL